MAARRLACALLVLGVGADSLADRTARPAPLQRGGYFVMAADFHVHSFFGDGALAPWLLVRQADRLGLDAIAITNHNRVWPARLARWFARRAGGPIVLLGDEVTARTFHIAAVGVERPVDWTHTAAAAIEGIHAQGGIAIAAHPGLRFWPAYDAAALAALDGAEREHPDSYQGPAAASANRRFAIFFKGARAYQPRLAAIGSSDFHVVGSPGFCRTFVFAREPSASGILDAVRAGRTVVYDLYGQPHGDASLFPLVAGDHLAETRAMPRPGLEGLGVWLGLLGLLLIGRGSRRGLAP